MAIVSISGLFVKFSTNSDVNSVVSSVCNTETTTYLSSNNPQSTLTTVCSQVSISSTSTVTVPANSSLASSSGKGWDNLDLVLQINSSQITSGQGVTVSVYDFNTLNSNDTVNLPRNSTNGQVLSEYPAPGLTLAPCPDPMMPGIYKGAYTASNISSAVPLQIFPPVGASCPSSGHFMQSVKFAPRSANIIGLGEYVSTNTFNGYWITGLNNNCVGDNASYTGVCPYEVPFTTGTYTVVGGDQWGDLAILYLTVLG